MSAAKEKPTGLALLREPFPANQVGKLPKPQKRDDQDKGRCERGSRYSADGYACGGWHARSIHLDFVGHAALTDRLLDADPGWSWEPVAFDERGLPALDGNGGLWLRLTVCGVTRLGYGDAAGKRGGDAVKEAIGDGLRNAGMRFGAALDLWHKGDLHADSGDAPAEPPASQASPSWSQADVDGFSVEIAHAKTPADLDAVGSRLAASGITGTEREELRGQWSVRAKELSAGAA